MAIPARQAENTADTPIMATSVDARHVQRTPAQKLVLPRWSKKSEPSAIARACSWVVDNQIGISATLISLLFAVHYFYPDVRHHTEKFFRISYFNPQTGRFALGWDDLFFVFFWIIVFSGLRCTVMAYLLAPLGALLGLSKRKQMVRFSEQTWIILYYTASSLVGMSIVYHSDYWMDLDALWKDWPTREMDGFNKWYYLVQFAFYTQQIVVVNIEERRKDYWQMLTHHVVTCTLIFGSYGYHFTKVGTLILVLMDTVDVFLPLAKVFRYLKFRLVCDITFGVFMIVWLWNRHIMFGMTWWNAYEMTDTYIKHGCYSGSDGNLRGPFLVPNDWSHVIEPFRSPVGQICYNFNVKWIFLGLLASLQCIILFWFCLIVRVAYKVITGQGAEDVRSDDEDEADIEEQQLTEEKSITPRSFIEREVDSTQINFSHTPRGGRPVARSLSQTPVRRSSRRKADGSSTGVNILGGSSDRKELLGRIGCDKPTDE